MHSGNMPYILFLVINCVILIIHLNAIHLPVYSYLLSVFATFSFSNFPLILTYMVPYLEIIFDKHVHTHMHKNTHITPLHDTCYLLRIFYHILL